MKLLTTYCCYRHYMSCKGGELIIDTASVEKSPPLNICYLHSHNEYEKIV